MKKNLFKTVLLAVVAGLFVACDDDEPNVTPPVEIKNGAYIVNNGYWNANNGSIQFYNYETDLVSGDLFKQENGRGIGDAQDLCIYGSKLYVTCSASAKLEILNLKGKVIKTIPLQISKEKSIAPRQLTAADGKVYFTSYNGTVSKVDTLTLSIEETVEVGPYPESLTIADNKLYVNISDRGAADQIAVVDLKTFTKITDIKVLLNPYNQSLTANGKVYFVSCGTYDDPQIPEADRILQTMQCLDPKTNEVTELCHASAIAYYNNKMYCIYADFYTPDKNSIFTYDLTTGETKSLIDPSEVKSPTAINVNPSNGDIYISASGESGAPGTVYVYDQTGKMKKELEVGVNPAGVRFLQR